MAIIIAALASWGIILSLILLIVVGISIFSLRNDKKRRKVLLIVAGVLFLIFLAGVALNYFYSRTEVIIEEEGILRIKATSEYAALIEKYGEESVTVKAVERHMLSEFNFLRQMDERFTEESGCIIVVEGPNGEGYVYQQDEEFNTIHQITLSQFKEGSKKIDQGVLEEFYGSLK